MNKNFKFISLVLSFVFCFSAIAFGQETGGSIEGTVRDPNGAVVPNATVTVKSTGTTAGFTRTVTADGKVSFMYQACYPEPTRVTAEGGGFKDQNHHCIGQLSVKQRPVDLTLEVGTGATGRCYCPGQSHYN